MSGLPKTASDGRNTEPCTGSNRLLTNADYVVHDFQIAWNTPWDSQIAVGARNIGSALPLNGIVLGWQPADIYLYSYDGRVTYLRYKQSF